MKPIRTLFIVSMLSAALPAAAASTDDPDWAAFGNMLTLVQQFVRIGGQPNPDQAMADLLAGRGVNLGAHTWSGRNAVDIARDNGNTQLADLLSRSLPVTR